MSLNLSTPSDTEIRTSRSFDAPRELVFAVHTQAAHLKHWWGRGNPLDVELDFRVGGRYRFVEHSDGEQYAFRGEFREIVEPERIVQTFEYEGMPGRICIETVEFTEEGGRTTVTGTTRFDTQDDRDGMLSSGMADGAEQSYLALDKYLAELS